MPRLRNTAGAAAAPRTVFSLVMSVENLYRQLMQRNSASRSPQPDTENGRPCARAATL